VRGRLLVAAFLAAAGATAALPVPARAQGCDYWVAPPPEGNDANPGTQALPWATLNFASAEVLAQGQSGATVCFKDGVYTGANSLYERFTAPTTFRAENTYRAILQNGGTAVSLFGARNMVFQGFEIRHTGPGAGALVVQVQMDGVNWSEDVVFRDNILHDSWNNDILKINNGARFVTVEGNVFYNQTGSDEHMDVNSVTDVLIQDNIFFNDFAGSGRPNNNDTSSFIVMKDSNADDDGQIGADRITVRRNVFLNWEGSTGSNFVLVGEDGMPYFEGEDILVENNLMIGNSANVMRADFGVKGGRNVTSRNNTVAGTLPTLAYAFRLNQEGGPGGNPVNENVVFHNNIWSDPTGTMGSDGSSGNDFSDGAPSEVTGLVLLRNLYWNGGAAIPPGDQVNPNVDDTTRIVANPQLNTNQSGIVLPHWNGTAFPSGSTTIRQEFVRLVNTYGAIPAGSPAKDQADPAQAPADDILGNPRTAPDIGAFEVTAPPTLSITDVTVTEGDTVPTQAAFTVSLSAASGQTVTVQYATADGTATAAIDYSGAGGILLFAPGTVTKTVASDVLPDLLDENDETFTMNLSNPTNATIADGQGTGTITDNDPLPFLFAGDCVADEGDAGSTPCSFTVLLAPASGRTVSVGYATADGTATAGSDYTAAGGVLTFPAGITQQPVNVAVLGDGAVEADEEFALNLAGPSNASVSDGQGVGTILDDDAPSLSMVEVSHGTDLRADMSGGTDDAYRISQKPFSSYEVLLDDAAGDVMPGLLLERVASDNVTVVQTAIPVGTGSALSLRWENTLAGTVNGQSLRLRSPSCGSGCGSDDVYRMRVRETTLSGARFNNAGSQVTVVVLQNTTGQPVSGHLEFWSPSGALLANVPLALGPRMTMVANTASLPGLPGQGGTLTVSHDAPYGALVGKAVALEPATGFSFDTPLEPRR
jgi:hypothetical protein